jgi:hypothetical protein
MVVLKTDSLGIHRGEQVLHADRRVEERAAVALSLCTTAHPLYTRFTNIFGTSISEATMRPNPTSRSSRCSSGESGAPKGARGWACGSAIGSGCGLGGGPLTCTDCSPARPLSACHWTAAATIQSRAGTPMAGSGPVCVGRAAGWSGLGVRLRFRGTGMRLSEAA